MSSPREPFQRLRGLGLSLLSWPVLGTLLVLGGLLGVAAWRGLVFVEQELAPSIEVSLQTLLNRPVKLGPLQRYSLTELEFGRSTIPPHPYKDGSGIDQDRGTAESVVVRFNLWQILVNRTLPLDVVLNRANVYLDQAPDDRWIGTKLATLPETGWLKFRLQSMQVSQGTVTLAPKVGPQRILRRTAAKAVFGPNNEQIQLRGNSEVNSGGKVTLNGTWRTAQQQLVLNARTQALAIAPLMSLLPPSPIQIRSGQYDGNLRLTYAPRQPTRIESQGTVAQFAGQWPAQRISGQAQRINLDMGIQLIPNQAPVLQGKAFIQGGEGNIPEDLILANGRQRRQTARNLKGTVEFLGASQRTRIDMQGALAVGGQVQVKGEVRLPLEAAKLAIRAQNVPATLFDQAYQLPIQVRRGLVDGNITVQLQEKRRPALLGTAVLKGVDAAVQGIPQPFLATNGLLQFNGLTVKLDQVASNYGRIPLRANGTIDPDRGYNLRAETGTVEANTALNTLQVGALPFPVAGQIRATDLRVVGAIQEPVLTGQAVNVGQVIVDRIPLREASAQFRFIPGALTIPVIAARPVESGTITGQASLQLAPDPSDIRLRATFQASGLSGDTIARFYQASPGFAIGLVSGTAVLTGPTSDVETAVQFQAPGGTYPTTGRVRVRQGKAFLEDVVAKIRGGNLLLEGLIAAGRVNVTATLPKLTLADYSADLRGAMSGRLAITGPLASFGAKTARARGTLRFSQGLSLIQDPLVAQIRWNGQKILVDRATAPNFLAQGAVGASIDGPRGPQLTTLNLNILAEGYQINRLSALGLPKNPLYGLATLEGRLTGTVSAPALNSRLFLSDFQASQLAFEPLLTGSLNFDMVRGLNLDVVGQRDRIQVALDGQQRPISLDIRRDKATLIGRRTTANRFDATLMDIPLTALNEFPQLTQAIGSLSGLASGTLAMDLRNLESVGTFRVERPGLGRFIGERLTGEFRYAQGVGTLRQAILVKGNNRYQLDATLTNFADPQVSGRLLIAQAQIEDLIAVATSLRFPLGPSPAGNNFGQAVDVPTTAVNLSDIPLWQQLQRLAEVDAFLAQQRVQQYGNGTLPDWRKLQGLLAGEIRFSGSLRGGVEANFDLKGNNWLIEPYRFEQFVAKGQLDAQGLTLQPLALTYGTSLASFAGRVGGDKQAGQLVLRDFPAETIADVFELPLNLTGKLSGRANLSGRWNNPAVAGQFNIAQGSLNRTPLTQAETRFDYRDARLGFSGLATLDSPEPIQVQGNIPYALPFAAVQPSSQAVDIAMSVKNQGLSLVNLFTDQVSWVDGRGDLSLRVTGDAPQPLVKGALTLQDATLRSPTLAEPLTNVSGAVQFNADRIMVKSLTGRYNNEALAAEGNLPLFKNNLRLRNPLAVTFNNTVLSVKGLYQGQASGNLTVTGSALQPNLGGLIALQNGQVLLSDTTTADAAENSESTATNAGASAVPVEFENLQVRLGKNIRILQPPILNFMASGQVDLNGSIDAPRPNGLVKFNRGSVNLFTTLFRVDTSKDNYAQFMPAYGLDPYLNLSMRTTVTEVVGGRATALNEFEEVQAGTLGSVESVRIRANIQGRASQLSTRFNDVLELSSTPGRSQDEILALLSGGVGQSLAAGDAGGALVNLAGSTFLNPVQGFASDLLGNRANFRLFPLLTPTKDRSSTVLELGAEFGYDVTDRLSVSLLQIVTTPDESPQLNVSYDVTDQLRVRSSVNFRGDAVGIVEYRLRF
jgi:translocation and assembly module TamB